MERNEPTDRKHGQLPELLAQEEVIGLLGLDMMGLRDPKETLRHLRATGQLDYVKVAGKELC